MIKFVGGRGLPPRLAVPMARLADLDSAKNGMS